MRRPTVLLSFVALALATLVACSSAAQPPASSGAAPAATPKGTVYAMSIGGQWEDQFNKIAPEFKKATGWDAKFIGAGGTSVAILNQLQAQKDNPQADLLFVFDEIAARQGLGMGLFAPWDPKIVTNAQYVPDWAKNKDYVLNTTGAVVVIYNTKVFKDKGWAPPTSFEDLFDPKYAGHVVLQPATGQYTMSLLVYLAKSRGGGEAKIDPGFQRMKELAPKVLSFEGTSQRFGELFQSEEGWIGVYSNLSPFDMKKRGFPIDFIVQKEGAILAPHALLLVKGRPAANTEGANLLMNFMLGDAYAQHYALEMNLTPFNSTVKLPAEVAQRTLSKDQVEKSIRLDWDAILKDRGTWNERWQKEIETIKRGQ